MILIKNIKSLVGVNCGDSIKAGSDLQKLECIENAYLLIKDDKIEDFG